MFTLLFLGYKALYVIPFFIVDYLLITGTIDLIKYLKKRKKENLPQ